MKMKTLNFIFDDEIFQGCTLIAIQVRKNIVKETVEKVSNTF